MSMRFEVMSDVHFNVLFKLKSSPEYRRRRRRHAFFSACCGAPIRVIQQRNIACKLFSTILRKSHAATFLSVYFYSHCTYSFISCVPRWAVTARNARIGKETESRKNVAIKRKIRINSSDAFVSRCAFIISPFGQFYLD